MCVGASTLRLSHPFHKPSSALRSMFEERPRPCTDFDIHPRPVPTAGICGVANTVTIPSWFFVPLHVEHLGEWCPEAVPYLALPPGWRFLLAPDYEDVWFDATLLEI